MIKGWTEAMQLMVEGDKWEIYHPSDLAYGESGSPPNIKGGDALIFTMEIIKINGPTKPAQRCDIKTKEGCSDKEKAFLAKQASKSVKELDSEIKRLNGMQGAKMSPDAATWLGTRVRLLGKLKDEL